MGAACWLPMDTAPKDGTEVLGFYRRCRIVMRWHPVEEQWVSSEPPHIGDIRGYAVLDPASWRGRPFVWRPLPSPPPDTGG